MKSKVLVVAAHPDDEVLGCGGTIARLAREGVEVHVAILGEGETSRSAKRGQAGRSAVKALRARSRKAAAALSAAALHTYDLPDNRFDSVPLLEVVKIVEGLVQRLKPRVVYTHHGGDLNIDHAVTHRATLTATRTLAGAPVKELYTFEVPSSTEWSFQQFEPAFRPTLFMDISGSIEAKIRAMQAYESEMRPYPHPRSAEALRAIARRWGSVAGLQYAEAFSLVRAIR